MRTRSIRSRLGIAGAVAVCALGFACDSRKPEKSSTSAADPLAGMTVHSYTVRGEVVSLPSDTTDLQVHHEAIPEFKNPDGSLGMDTMIMPFWPPQGLSMNDPRITKRIEGFKIDGIAVGQVVELTFDVLWDSDNKIAGFYATSIVPLPAGTALDFSPLKEGATFTE